jgi:hypothetical protein
MAIIFKSLGSTKVNTLDTSNSEYGNTFLSGNAFLEQVTAQGVSHITWTGDWQITQSGNLLFKSAIGTSGDWNLAEQGVILYGQTRQANIIANTTTSNSTLIMTITKTILSNT